MVNHPRDELNDNRGSGDNNGRGDGRKGKVRQNFKKEPGKVCHFERDGRQVERGTQGEKWERDMREICRK